MSNSIDGLMPCLACEGRQEEPGLYLVCECGRKFGSPRNTHLYLSTMLADGATRTPALSLGEDAVERVARAIEHLIPGSRKKASAEKIARAALTAMPPVQEEGLGEGAALNADSRPTPLAAAIWKELESQGFAREDAWDSTCGIVEALAARPEASPPSLGVEELRELSERATQGPWHIAPYWHAAGTPDEVSYGMLVGDDDMSIGIIDEKPCSVDSLSPDLDFIVACVNHVRKALSRVTGDRPSETTS